MALTAEQLDERRHGIGGSDAGAVLGLSPYRTPLQVWLEKTGRAEPADLSENEAVTWGNLLEDTIAREYSRRTGHRVWRRNATLTHPECPWMLAHLDRVIVGEYRGPGVLEIKTAGQHMADKWGPSGTDQVPDEYLAQVAHYLAVTGYTWARLAVLIGGRDLRIYDLPRDEELITMLIGHEEQFWREHVEANVPPPPVTVEDIETLYAVDNGESLLAPPEIEEACQQLASCKAAIKSLEERKKALEQQIKGAMADASVLVDAEGNPLATWKKARDSKRLDTRRLQAERPDVYEQYLKEQPGSRRFLLKVKAA